MKSSKQFSNAPEKAQQEPPEKPDKPSGRIRLNSLGDLALLRLQNAAENARKVGVATVTEHPDGAWSVQFTPLQEQG